MSDETQIAIKASVKEIIAKRDQALAMYRSSLIEFRAGNKLLQEAIPGASGFSLELDSGHIRCYSEMDDKDIAQTMEQMRRKVDRYGWEHLIGAAGIRNLMDAKTIQEFRKNLENPPELTLDNIRDTISGLHLQRDSLFRSGLVNVFKSLSGYWAREYKSNSAFKIGRRIILPRAIESFYVNRRDEFSDLDRIFHILDKKDPPDHCGDLGSLIGAAKRSEDEIVTPYFKVRWFRNRNAHVYFLRADLLDKANQLIAEEMGPALGDGK